MSIPELYIQSAFQALVQTKAARLKKFKSFEGAQVKDSQDYETGSNKPILNSFQYYLQRKHSKTEKFYILWNWCFT